jgi:hypothetical protein
MQKVITLPVRCSVVRKSTTWLKRIIAAESIVLYLLSALYVWIVPSYYESVFGRIAFVILLIGTVCIVCCAIIGSIEGWYPKLECIKDDEVEP